jgi:HD-GYP domain-containing protein (c-di-GMP phosphodiesterase class II)
MMTIADVFDALAASDRPYKRAVAPDRALDILRAEARSGRIDRLLLDLFIDAKVYDSRASARPAPAD